jgi:hypothetical protein
VVDVGGGCIRGLSARLALLSFVVALWGVAARRRFGWRLQAVRTADAVVLDSLAGDLGYGFWYWLCHAGETVPGLSSSELALLEKRWLT